MMTLRPGATSDDNPSNEHPSSEQWIYVVSGVGEAIVGKNRASLRLTALREGSLLLIEKGELHQMQTGSRPAPACHGITGSVSRVARSASDTRAAGWTGNRLARRIDVDELLMVARQNSLQFVPQRRHPALELSFNFCLNFMFRELVYRLLLKLSKARLQLLDGLKDRDMLRLSFWVDGRNVSAG